MSDERWRAINGRIVFPRTDGQLPGADHDFAIMGGQEVAETLAESINAQLDAKAALLDDAVKALVALEDHLVTVAHEADFGAGVELCWCKPESMDDDATHVENMAIRSDLIAAQDILTRLRDVPVHDTKGG